MYNRIVFLSFLLAPSAALAAPSLDREATQIASRTLSVIDSLPNLGVKSADITVARAEQDVLTGGQHVRLQQSVAGIPVFGGEGIVHFTEDWQPLWLTDNFVRGDFPNRKPSVPAREVLADARREASLDGALLAEESATLVFLPVEGKKHLAWKVALTMDEELAEEIGVDPAMPMFFFDAHDGRLLLAWDNLHTSGGTSSYYGTVTLDTSSAGRTNFLEDTTRLLGARDAKNSQYRSLPFPDRDGAWTATAQAPGVDALYGLSQTWDYYRDTFGRDGIDDAGGPSDATAASNGAGLITARARYGRNYNNAFWNGSYIALGTGDGSYFSSLSSLDVIAHEYTHGVTEYTAGLVYLNEPGALNEAMSDIFGTMVERAALGASANWQIGEDCYTPGTSGDALRFMDSPNSADDYGYTIDDDPDHYDDRYRGRGDNGGVHVNSGIVNHMFYLLSEGGTHRNGGSMTGIGADAAADILYLALTSYMTSSTDFAGARDAMELAATDLYGSGSTEYTAVGEAWDLVGV